MKYQLGEKDYLEKHHIFGLIHKYLEDNDDFNYSVIQFNYQKEKPITTIYGVSFIRSQDVEEDFIIVT